MATAETELKSAKHEERSPDTDITPTDQREKKRKRKTKSTTIGQFCIRDPPWTYLHLKHHTQAASSNTTRDAALDETTVSMFVDTATGQFLGLHGRAIPMDILRLDASDVWVRIPRQDRPAFVAALTGWIGRNGDALRVVGWSSWDASAMGRESGQDLFTN